MAVLDTMTPTLIRTLMLIKDYVKATGRKSFTYRQLQWFWRRSSYTDLHWHSVERAVRKLAGLGYLERRLVKSRYYKKPIAVFIVTSMFYEFFEELEELRKQISRKVIE